MDMTFVFMPNCAGPPHLGHVLNLMVTMELMEKAGSEFYKRLAVFFDCEIRRGEYEEDYVDLARSVDPAGPEVEVFYTGGTSLWSQTKHMASYSATESANVRKVVWLSGHNVRFVARAHDAGHSGSHMNMGEISGRDLEIARMFHLSHPRTCWHPLLLDEDGKKIGHDNCDDYQVNMTHDNLTFVKGLLRNLCFGSSSMTASIFNHLPEPIMVPRLWRGLTAGSGDRPTSKAAGTAPKASPAASPPSEFAGDAVVDSPENGTSAPSPAPARVSRQPLHVEQP